MIVIDDVHKRLGQERVLRGVTLSVDRGEVVALVGPSGTGKSVLLKHIVGLVVPDRGDVRLGGRSVARAGPKDLRRLRRRMGYAFQDGALLDSVTVRENLRLAFDDEVLARRPDYVARRIGETLDDVNLPSAVLDKRPAELSGGTRKRVGVARAVLNSPEVILFDEPTTGLDPTNVAAVNGLVRSARAVCGATCVVVTHDLPTLPGLADRVVLLLDGRVHAEGTPEAFFASPDPRVRAFIGGSDSRPQEDT